MAAKSDYWEQQILNYFRGTAITAAPANVYIALYTAAPSDAGGGTEVTGGAYARLAVPVATASWTAPTTAGVISNAIAFTFPTPTAAWGNIGWFGVLSATTGGNLYYHGALTASRSPLTGDPVSFPVGSFTITEA